MERLKSMKETLICCIQAQMTHLDTVDTKELGEAMDMVKDLSEAIYYQTITDAMEQKEHEGHDKENRYYIDYRMMDKGNGRMYYSGNFNRSSGIFVFRMALQKCSQKRSWIR